MTNLNDMSDTELAGLGDQITAARQRIAQREAAERETAAQNRRERDLERINERTAQQKASRELTREDLALVDQAWAMLEHLANAQGVVARQFVRDGHVYVAKFEIRRHHKTTAPNT